MVPLLSMNLQSTMLSTIYQRYLQSRFALHATLIKQLTFPQLIGLTSEQDRGMRIHLYFMLSIEGSVQSQMVRFMLFQNE